MSNITNTNTIIFYAKTASDTRHTASSVGSIDLPAVVNAAKIARLVDAGDCHLVARDYPQFAQALSNAAIGHGVTIKYRNGRLRTIRA